MLPIVAVVVWGSIVQGVFLAVILHPEGKAMDSASISFRQEQGLMLRKGQDFPNSFHSGWDSFLRFLRHSQIFEQLFVLINTKEVFWNMQALKYR